jgi:phospholipase/lecithinase/hemolysin
LREIVAGKANVKLCEGRALLPEWRRLSADLLHPTDYGHTLIAENLTKEIITWT